MATKTVFRVLSWDPQRFLWVIKSEHNSPLEAQVEVNAIKKGGGRARILPAEKRLLAIKAPVVSNTRRLREQQAGLMSDKADANKRYKSPG